MRALEPDEIEPLATGAWILGADGCCPYDGFLNLRQRYRDGVRIALMQAKELDNDDLVAVVSTMGAPPGSATLRRPPSLAEKPSLH